MADDKPDTEKEAEVTPKGAVEVDEKDLDKAEGGISAIPCPPQLLLNFTKTLTTTRWCRRCRNSQSWGGLSVDPPTQLGEEI